MTKIGYFIVIGKGKRARCNSMPDTLYANRDFSPISVQGPPLKITPCTSEGEDADPEERRGGPGWWSKVPERESEGAGGRKGREKKRKGEKARESQDGPPPATLPEQFLQFGGVVTGEDDVMVPDGVGQEVAGSLGGEPQDSLGAAEIGFGLAP